MEIKIRFAAAGDAEDILKIYSEYIDTSITFEYTLPDVDTFSRRITETLENYPFLVILADNKIAGYAYAHRLREREAYNWVCETSVYTSSKYSGLGFGRKLYFALLGILKAQNIRAAYACVTVPNTKSDTLHTALGFSLAGTFNGCGYKCGSWHSVNWYEKILNTDCPPKDFVPFEELNREKANEIIQSFS